MSKIGSGRTPESAGSSAVAESWRNTLAEFKRAIPAAAAEAQAESVFPPEGTHFIFRPMLRVQRKRLTIFTCLAAREVPGVGLLTGDNVLGPYAPSSRVARLDTLALRDALKQLGAHRDGQAATLICLPLHLDTLGGEPDTGFVAMLETLPPALSRRLVYEIVDAARGRGSPATAKLLRRLRACSAAVFGRVNPRDPDLRVWKTAGLAAAGIDMEDEGLAAVDTIKALSVFGATARRQGVSVYARGLRTRETALAAIAAGYSYIEGVAVHEGDTVLPPRPAAYDMKRLQWG